MGCLSRTVKDALSLTVHDRFVLLEGFVPAVSCRGLIGFGRNGAANRLALFCKIPELAGSDGLRHRVAERGSLDRSGHNWPPACIGGHLAEDAIEASSADHADGRVPAAGEAIKLFECASISQA